MNKKYQLGKQGEELAANYLSNQHYRIIEQRWHHHHLEIDIIAIDETSQELVVIEVKTRSSEQWGKPEDAVDMKKIRHMVHSADTYIKMHYIDLPVRFDIISVVLSEGNPKIDHIKDAFYPPLG